MARQGDRQTPDAVKRLTASKLGVLTGLLGAVLPFFGNSTPARTTALSQNRARSPCLDYQDCSLTHRPDRQSLMADHKESTE